MVRLHPVAADAQAHMLQQCAIADPMHWLCHSTMPTSVLKSPWHSVWKGVACSRRSNSCAAAASGRHSRPMSSSSSSLRITEVTSRSRACQSCCSGTAEMHGSWHSPTAGLPAPAPRLQMPIAALLPQPQLLGICTPAGGMERRQPAQRRLGVRLVQAARPAQGDSLHCEPRRMHGTHTACSTGPGTGCSAVASPASAPPHPSPAWEALPQVAHDQLHAATAAAVLAVQRAVHAQALRHVAGRICRQERRHPLVEMALHPVAAQLAQVGHTTAGRRCCGQWRVGQWFGMAAEGTRHLRHRMGNETMARPRSM